MPDGLVPAEDGGSALKAWLQSPILGSSQQFRLWTNSGLTPDYTVVLSDLTYPTWAGYTHASVDRSQWQNPTVNLGCFSISYGVTPVIWFCNATNTIPVIGWALVDVGLGKLMWIQRFDTVDQLTPTLGDVYVLNPKITEASKPC